MDIEKIWHSHSPAVDNLPNITRIAELHSADGNNPLKRLKDMLLINIRWTILIVGLYIAVLLFGYQWQIQVLVSISLAATLTGTISAWRLRKRIGYPVLPNNLLAELKRNRDALVSWMRIQSRMALCVYPICISGGFLLGGVVGSGKSVESLINDHRVILILIITILILTPVSYWLAKWMFRQSFGMLLDRLDDMIGRLEGNDDV